MPRFLCLSDIHARFNLFEPSAMPIADAVLIAGDVTEEGCHTERGKAEVRAARDWMIALADRYGAVFYIPGNHDIGVNNSTWHYWRNKDHPARDPNFIMGVQQNPIMWRCLSINGVSCSPCYAMPKLAQQYDFMTASEEVERAAYDIRHCDILLSHSPPRDILDTCGQVYNPETYEWAAEHIGSRALRDYITRHAPHLVVCGHVHEQNGYVTIPETDHKTLVVNCAERYCLVDVPLPERKEHERAWVREFGGGKGGTLRLQVQSTRIDWGSVRAFTNDVNPSRYHRIPDTIPDPAPEPRADPAPMGVSEGRGRGD